MRPEGKPFRRARVGLYFPAVARSLHRFRSVVSEYSTRLATKDNLAGALVASHAIRERAGTGTPPAPGTTHRSGLGRQAAKQTRAGQDAPALGSSGTSIPLEVVPHVSIGIPTANMHPQAGGARRRRLGGTIADSLRVSRKALSTTSSIGTIHQGSERQSFGE
ncbi:hypothetical protein BCV69DRAFT_127641 [Microstroma glucosiphilum]|uniref:Uncharacterized protein n=1 Tax=Pseudomicrostroma glucosiphilum TaxID=1684307 RepID=A0A316TW38_9BASI|nr:hypothetical protein BCV69DRAFT_127641 [Pseudomicrostroma glucosiphilum]PWN17726.1 hypothetical protein BCV69DRAFT_127641 [Pseudomicrostroma glucosiphilum]